MSPTINLKALPLHRLLALAGAILLFASLFLPWLSLSSNPEIEAIMGVSSDDSVSGWDGIGRLAGVAALLVIAWEVTRLMGRAQRGAALTETVALVISGTAAVLAGAQFIRAVANSETVTLGSTKPGTGAYLILVSSLALIAAVVVGVKDLGILSLGASRKGDSVGSSLPPPQTDTPPPPPPPPAGPRDM